MGFKSIQARRANHQIFQPLSDTRLQGVDRSGTRAGPEIVIYVNEVGSNGDILKGFELGKKLREYISEITWEEDEKMASQLMVQFNDPDHIVSESRFISPGNTIDLQIGYNRNTVFYGRRIDLVAAYPVFPEDGIPTYDVKGYDGRHKMTNGDFLPGKRQEQRFSKIKNLGAVIPNKKRRKGAASSPITFKKKTDAEIVDRIAYHYGYAIDVDPTTTRRTRVKKKGVSDWEFILRLAKLNNYTTWVDFDDILNNWVVHFRKKERKFTRGYQFDYNLNDTGTLRSVTIREELSKQVTDIEISHFDKRLRKLSWQTLEDQKRFNLPDGPLETPLSSNRDEVAFVDAYGASVKFKIGGRVIQVFNDKPFKSKKDAQEFAKNYIINQQEDFILAEGQVIGTENLRPRQIHRLDGIGRFSGDYYFTQVRHKFPKDQPYVTDFIAYRIVPEFVYLDLRIKQLSSEFGGSTAIGK